MGDLAIKILREFGLPTLLALALGAMLWWQMQRNEEAVDRWATLMEYVMDVRADCAKR